MKRTEKMIASLLLIALGVVLAVLQGDLISILMSALGIGLLVLACMDLYQRNTLSAVIKAVVGVMVIFFGWVLVSAVLYLIAAALIVLAIVWIYERLKCNACKENLWRVVMQYVQPLLLFCIGVLLLFNQGETVAWVFIISGVLTVIEGGLLLANALISD